MGNCQKGENRVIRGGSYFNEDQNCRAANRNHNEPTNRNDNIGFRLALSAHGQAGWLSLNRRLSRS